MSCDCYTIGGPFIAEDPDCPEHGTEAQAREREESRRAAPIAAQLDQDAKSLYESWQHAQSNRCNVPPWEKACEGVREEWRATAAARKAGTGAAQLDAELPPPDALVKRSEWCDAKAKRQSFNGWRINYGDCDMPLFTEITVRQVVALYAERIRLLEHKVWCAEVNLDGAKEHLAELERERAAPVWAAYADNGNVIIWSRNRAEVEPVAAKYGKPVVPVIAHIDGRTAGTAPKAPDPTEEAIERRAKEIYAGFVFADRHPWVDGGNSIRQDDARYQARAEFAAAPSPQENTNG